MVRFDMDEGHINIAWGHDEVQGGYFLAVVDNRLGWEKESSSDVNNICEKVAESGGGSYFDLNTYHFGGFGHKVSEATIFTFMRRYGIDPATILPSQDGPVITIDTGGETAEMRIDPTYIMRRREKIQKTFVSPGDKAKSILVDRVDRTVIKISKEYNVPIIREGLVPPIGLAYTFIYFPQAAFPEDFHECTHPDCCFPEMHNAKFQRCSSCKQVTYCSKVCQKADWNRHKISCLQNNQ
ncbi:hypothetical protein BGX27_003840 [Mortierella sp. AM989]|nr:hypothetical protein BGX27_003840 [Mortierella sp. AM989]